MDSLAKKSLTVLLTFLILSAGFVGLIYLPRSDAGPDEEFVIERGDGSAKVAGLLAERGLVRSKHLFIFYTVLVGREKEFKAGRYLISQSMNIPEIVRIFSSGLAESDDIEVTIPEGTNIADMERILVKAGLIKAGELLTPTNIEVAEGVLFPDTYRFDPNTNVGEIFARLNSNYTEKVVPLLSGKSQWEKGKIIIIASILEREVRTEQDMRLVAGIIEKRLERDMPLEVDATVAYGVCYPSFLEGKYCDVSLANIVDNIPVDSGYNTYRRKGLPTGPVSNPGLTAIRAAMNPEPSDYLYYLSAKDGTTIFSKTAAEHQKARRKYLNI